MTRDGVYLSYHEGYPFTAIIKWDGMLTTDDGQWRLLSHYKEKCIHIFGTWGGAKINIEGTNEDANLVAPSNQLQLTDPAGITLVFDENDIRHVRDNPLYIRPLVVGGDGTTSLTVLMVCRH